MILNNKIIIVTGGSGTLGKEMVKDIIAEGGTAVNFDINITNDLGAGEWNCDVTSDLSIKESIQQVYRHYGKIDGFVNNAYPRTSDWGASFEEMSPDSWRKNVDMQLNSYFVCCQEILKIMKTQQSGSIVNIASIYGVVGNDFTIYENTPINASGAYAAIKGGVVNFSRFLASCYGKDNIRVNCVSPGGIFANQHEEFVKAYEKKVPMKRMGNPDDIAPPVSFLLSDKAKYITGQNLLVDGGWTAI